MFFLSSCKMFVFSAEGQKTEKAAEKCSLGKILRDMQDTCCKKECVKGVSPQTVLSKRTLYWEKSCKDRMAYVYHAIETGKVEEKGNLLMVESGLVCTKAWCIIHAITPSWQVSIFLFAVPYLICIVLAVMCYLIIDSLT